MPERSYVKTPMGRADEISAAAEPTLAGIPALMVPEIWSGYNVVSRPLDKPPQRISVKARTFAKSGTFVAYDKIDVRDWLAG